MRRKKQHLLYLLLYIGRKSFGTSICVFVERFIIYVLCPYLGESTIRGSIYLIQGNTLDA